MRLMSFPLYEIKETILYTVIFPTCHIGVVSVFRVKDYSVCLEDLFVMLFF